MIPAVSSDKNNFPLDTLVFLRAMSWIIILRKNHRCYTPLRALVTALIKSLKNSCLNARNRQLLMAPLKIHFGGQTNLLAFGRCQTKAALASTKADLSSLPKNQNLLLAAQKQLLELPLKLTEFFV